VTLPGPIIPGETPIDLSHLTAEARAQGITNRRELSVLEAKNVATVFVKYLSAKPSSRLAPFTFNWALRLHQQMFCNVWKWAGRIRDHDVNIGDPHPSIRGALFSLLEDLKTWPGYQMPLIEQAVRLHHRAVKIHPFPNGNGRWSRLLSNIWLKRNDVSLVLWPEELIGQQSLIRDDYIAAIRDADSGDYEALISMHVQYQEKTASAE
jgi:Fic-DOC domain mobile mystery protein B